MISNLYGIGYLVKGGIESLLLLNYQRILLTKRVYVIGKLSINLQGSIYDEKFEYGVLIKEHEYTEF
tara:strand:- start:272 stop:472 length:201 start_codon:yes stop_codon:yes gene_type:complete